MPPFGVRIKLKTTGKGYVSSPFLLPEYRKYDSNPLLAFHFAVKKWVCQQHRFVTPSPTQGVRETHIPCIY